MKWMALLLSIALPFALAGMPWRGYLVSKNDVILTGYIGPLVHQSRTSVVTFINDFGDVYEIEAERIRGFGFYDEDELIAYESCQVTNRWRFLQILVRGKVWDLYGMTENIAVNVWPPPQPKAMQPISYWISSEGKRFIKIGPLGFRRKIRRLLGQNAPALADKIGQRGYRFRDMAKIVEAYNQLMSPKPFQL